MFALPHGNKLRLFRVESWICRGIRFSVCLQKLVLSSLVPFGKTTLTEVRDE